MDRNQKSSISTFLLVVGAIFILVAGSIFVTTAWKYLPEFVKQLALLGVAGGLFAGAYGVSKNEKLGKIEQVLFYLGVAFVGFFAIAIMGGLTNEGMQLNACKMFFANVIMAIPVMIKLMVRKGGFEFSVLSLLVNSVLISGCVALESKFDTYLLFLAGYVVILAVVDYFQQKKTDCNSLALCIGFVYLIHAICYVTLIAFYILFSDKAFVSIILALAVVIMTSISWKGRTQVAVRVCNSVSIMWFVFVTMHNMLAALNLELGLGVTWLLIVTINSIIMLLMRRKEIVWIQAITALVIPFVQILMYWLEAWDLFSGVDESKSATYYAFSFVYAVAFVALYIIENGINNSGMEWKYSRKLKFAGLQMITGFVVWMTAKNLEAWGMTFFILNAITMLTGATYLKDSAAKRIFKTLAMFAWIIALFCQPFFDVPANYMTEWNCFLVAMGIVLFRFIWYDKKEEFGIVYFVTTCILLSILLLHNLAVEGLGNMLILGMTGIVMLVASAIMNNRKYVIASSTVLLILVFYLTREFWLSIAWWVYLFVAGVILVLLAIKKEKDA